MTVSVKPYRSDQPLLIRGQTSDVETFFSIITRSGYPTPDRKVRLIIDAGANVGYSAAFFSNAYPDAKVLALEPEKENFQQLLKNTSHFPNVVPLNCALWSESKKLFLQNPSAEPWAFEYGTEPTTDDSVEAFSLTDFMTIHEIDNIDILKVDIEGAEKELFSGDLHWLNSVDTIFIEIHDRLVEGAGTTIFRAMSKYQYYFDVRFEYAIFDKIKSL